MTCCPACQHDFPLPEGGSIPHRCPQCISLVLGNYSDLEWIGGGGMGDVYRAREPAMGNRTIAIKIPKTDFDSDLARRRFETEIAASARLEHENVVRAYHRGTQGARSYLVMEHVVGGKLSEAVRPEFPLAPRRVAAIVLGIAHGIAHGAERGVIHRDVKPGNVLLAQSGETPKIHDYGLALIATRDEPVTRTGALLGTPNYTAPEQAVDPHGVTIAADVYALGCTAFYCLAGYPPFRAGTVDEILRLHAEAPRPSVRRPRSDVSLDLDRLIQAMLSVDPRDRPGPRELAGSLEAILPRLSETPPPPPEAVDGPRVDATCPRCGTEYHLLASLAGKAVRCPNKLCEATFSVPARSTWSVPEVLDAEIVDAAREAPEGPPRVVEARIPEPDSAASASVLEVIDADTPSFDAKGESSTEPITSQPPDSGPDRGLS